jgi:glyoxylase-like metal-dependent hydrolase (beta-lactamase superfamily II)
MTLPVADRWFRHRQVSNTIVCFDEPHVDPLLRANLWAVRGRDRDLVVDTGLGVGSLRVELPKLFDRDPLVVLTHAHLDHSGGAADFDHVYAHPADLPGSPVAGTLNGPRLMAELGLQEYDETVPELLIDAIPYAGYEPSSYLTRPPRSVHPLADGDILDLGDRQFVVLHLPGHTPGTIGLYDRDDGTLFTGDCVYDDYLLDELAGSSIPDYVASMHRLRGLAVTQVHPGHGDSFGQQRLHDIIDAYLTQRG